MAIKKTASSLPIGKAGKVYGKKNLRSKRSVSIHSPKLDNKRLR